MIVSDNSEFFEIAVSYRFAKEHQWVVQAITGFLSAYYMENPQFRLVRRVHELETGMHVWICEAPQEKFIKRLLQRLQVDIPPCRIDARDSSEGGFPRQVIDLLEPSSD